MNRIRAALGSHIKKTLYISGLQTLLRRLWPASDPVILRYHSISDGNVLISDGIRVSVKSFEEQVKFFHDNFNVIKMGQVVEHILKKEEFPKNALVLTFDDGYRDNYIAAEILNRYQLSGMFYITAGCIETKEKFWVSELRHLMTTTNKNKVSVSVEDKTLETSWDDSEMLERSIRKLTQLIKSVEVSAREKIREQLSAQFDDVPNFPDDLMLTWQQLRDMVEMGMEIGAHTMTHCNLPSANTEEAWYEVSQCKALLEKQLDIEVRHFAYPNGGSVEHYDRRIKNLIKEAGFISSSTSKPAFISLDDDLLELRRIRATEYIYQMLWEMY